MKLLSSKTLSVIIPAYNEEKFIQETIREVAAANTLNLKKEIVIVDDGSKDKTPKLISDIIASFKKNHKDISFKAIIKKKNEGKGAALKDGFLASSGDIVMVQDADLEYTPEDYPLLLEPFTKHAANVVYGSRFITSKPHRVMFFWQYQANRFLTTFSNMLTNLYLTDMETGYKVFDGELIRTIAQKLESKRFGFEPEITARISKVNKIKGLRIYEVGISYYGRTYAEGKKIGLKDGIKAIWEIVKYNILTK